MSAEKTPRVAEGGDRLGGRAALGGLLGDVRAHLVNDVVDIGPRQSGERAPQLPLELADGIGLRTHHHSPTFIEPTMRASPPPQSMTSARTSRPSESRQ